MKHLLNGVAIAAALAIAVPAWAQAPMTPGAPRAPAAAPPATMAAPPAAPAAKQKKRPMRQAKGGKKGKMKMRAGAGDSMTAQLNREELARVGGGMAPPPGGPMGPGPANAGAGQGGPRSN
jgi:hypothetical protein